MIVMLPIEKLEPHPDNPRKDLGDLTELVKSIRQSGVLQNLTVVPAPGNPGHYRIVIGHRRFAAARQAGLKELPCSIEPNLTEAMQIATMLAENMQRNALTVADQVGGVQMMMDLGESAKAIADKTGLSGSTVRKRMQLAALQQDKLHAAEQRGATIDDLLKIARINSEERRGKLLESAGTADFPMRWRAAYDQQKTSEALETHRAEIESWAKLVTMQEWQSDHRRFSWVRSIQPGKGDADYSRPADAKDDEFVAVCRETYLAVYRIDGPAEPVPDQEARIRAQKRRDARKAACDAIRNRAQALREDFLIEEFRETAATAEVVMDFATESLINGRKYAYDDRKKVEDRIARCRRPGPAQKLAIAAHCFLSPEYAVPSYATWEGKFTENENLNLIYRHLTALGYQMSDEEVAWQHGTHPCFSDPDDGQEDA